MEFLYAGRSHTSTLFNHHSHDFGRSVRDHPRVSVWPQVGGVLASAIATGVLLRTTRDEDVGEGAGAGRGDWRAVILTVAGLSALTGGAGMSASLGE